MSSGIVEKILSVKWDWDPPIDTLIKLWKLPMPYMGR